MITTGSTPSPVQECRAKPLAAAEELFEGFMEWTEIGADARQQGAFCRKNRRDDHLNTSSKVSSVQRRCTHPLTLEAFGGSG